jgi:hypothetical protein
MCIRDSPGVETAFVTLESVISTPGARLGYFKRTVTVGVLVFVPAAMASGNGVLEATDALDDVMRTFEADRYLGLSGLGVRDLRVDGTAFSGQELNMKGYGVCSCNLIVDFSTTTGA